MKTQFALLAAAAVLGAVAAYDESTECPYTEIIKLTPLALDENLIKCEADSGWKMLPPVGYPTDAERVLMCDSVACFNLIDAVKKSNTSDCLVVFDSVKMNVKMLAEQFEPSCYH